jgi:hypothetical protein
VQVEDRQFKGVGARMSVFEDVAPAAVYAPAGASFSVTATTHLEFAIGSAPADGAGEARLIAPEAISKETRGQGANMRHVRNILPETAQDLRAALQRRHPGVAVPPASIAVGHSRVPPVGAPGGAPSHRIGGTIFGLASARKCWYPHGNMQMECSKKWEHPHE